MIHGHFAHCTTHKVSICISLTVHVYVKPSNTVLEGYSVDTTNNIKSK